MKFTHLKGFYNSRLESIWENYAWKWRNATDAGVWRHTAADDQTPTGARSHTVPRAVRSARRAHGPQKHTGKLHTIHESGAKLHLQATLKTSTNINIPQGFLSLSFPTKTLQKEASACKLNKVVTVRWITRRSTWRPVTCRAFGGSATRLSALCYELTLTHSVVWTTEGLSN